MSLMDHARRPMLRRGFWIALALSIVVVALFLLGVRAAHAQDATAVDLRPAATAAIEWLGVALLAVVNAAAGLGLRWLSVRTGLDRSRLEAEYNTRISDLIHRGIEYAITSAKTEVAKPDSPINKVELDNRFLAMAATYVNQRAPELLSHFRIDERALQEMVIARMPAYFGEVAVTGGASATTTAARVLDQMGVSAGAAASGQPAPVVLPATGDTAVNGG